MSTETALPLRDRYRFRYTFNPKACNAITCLFQCHGRRCHCGFASATAAAAAATAATAAAAAKPAAATTPAPRPKSKAATTANPPNPDIIYAPGDLPDEPATPDTPNGTPASPICIGEDGEPLISLRLANRYFMLLWGAILRGVAPFPEARIAMATTLGAYSRFYPGPFATG